MTFVQPLQVKEHSNVMAKLVSYYTLLGRKFVVRHSPAENYVMFFHGWFTNAYTNIINILEKQSKYGFLVCTSRKPITTTNNPLIIQGLMKETCMHFIENDVKPFLLEQNLTMHNSQAIIQKNFNNQNTTQNLLKLDT